MRKWKETDLCQLFIDKAREDGWIVYPEIDYWDILVVDPSNNEQIGIQAKGSLTWKVLSQAIKDRGFGPHRRAILVPVAENDFQELADSLKLGVYDLRNILDGDELYEETLKYHIRKPIMEPKYKWDTIKPCWLPEIIPDIPAGVPSPRRMTQWRQKALKLCKILRIRGYVTSKDFKNLKLSYNTWIYSGWIKPTHERIVIDKGRYEKYVIADETKLPDIGWEYFRDQLLED
jgi:hypothetical protein